MVSAFVAEPALLRLGDAEAEGSVRNRPTAARRSPHEKVGIAPAALTTGGTTPAAAALDAGGGGRRAILALVRTAVTGAIVILSVADAVLAFGGAAARAAAETVAEARRRVFCFSLAPGGATRDAEARRW